MYKFKQRTFLLLITITIALLFLHNAQKLEADTVTTSVTVGNTPPSFSGNATENPASDDTTPTDVGSDVTFEATANDPNLEDYYLIICKTNAVTATNGGAPTCDSGQWCISSSTTSGSQATCSYTVQATDTNESYDWYAFVCDSNSSSAQCSSANQGSGSSGSPFSVNHPPVFDTISNDGPKNPGEDVTWSTNASTTDPDTATTADTVKLIVCKTAGITADDCDGGASDRWCASAFVADSPSCSYTVPIPTADDTYDAYVYLVDQHYLPSTDTNQGTNNSYVVSNVNPVISNVVIDSGNDINLNESATYSATITADVTDNNGCNTTEIPTVVTSLYRSGVGYSSCDTTGEEDYDSCYPVKSCTQTSCTGAGATYSCTVDLQYHADPTDTNTQYTSENWLATVLATDDDSAQGSTESSSGVEVNSLTAMDVTSAIDYGLQTVGTNSGNLDQTTVVTATGNVGLDEQLSGTDMTDGSGHTIPVGKQHYDLSQVAYSSATALSTTDVESELNVAKTKSVGTTTTPETGDTWWGIEIPTGTVSGTYTGQDTVTAVKGEFADW